MNHQRQYVQHQIILFTGLVVSAILAAVAAMLEETSTREPYHTSILTGEG